MDKKIAIFASGSGSNAENIIRYFSDKSQYSFPLILSNNENAFVHERARTLNVKSLSFSKEKFVSGEIILDILKQYGIDFIVLAGFLLKIPTQLIEAYPNKIVNIHPALLPKFGGKGMYGDRVHQAVVDAKETQSGITIHYINEKYDEGNIIFQASCDILSTDSADDVAQKVHALEYKYYPEIIERLLQNG